MKMTNIEERLAERYDVEIFFSKTPGGKYMQKHRSGTVNGNYSELSRGNIHKDVDGVIGEAVDLIMSFGYYSISGKNKWGDNPLPEDDYKKIIEEIIDNVGFLKGPGARDRIMGYEVSEEGIPVKVNEADEKGISAESE